jgi:hypothetical protein
MTKAQIAQRERAAAAALGSVRAEGLNPSVKTQKRVQDYIKGRITVAELRSETLKQVKKQSR